MADLNVSSSQQAPQNPLYEPGAALAGAGGGNSDRATADALMGEADKHNAAAAALGGKTARDTKPLMDKYDKITDTPLPKPDQEKVPEAPKPQADMQKNGQEFMASAVLLASLAGALTRGHVTAALSSFGAAMKGFQQGQLQAGEEAFKEWKASSDRVIENNKSAMDQYKLAFEDKKASAAEIAQRVNMIATVNQDSMMAEAARGQNLATMAQLYNARFSADRQFAQSKDQFEQTHDLAKRTAEDNLDKIGINTVGGIKRIMDMQQGMSPDQQKKLMEVVGWSHPTAMAASNTESIDGYADMVGSYRAPMPSAYAQRTPWGQAVMTAISQKYPGFDGTRYGAVQAVETAFDKGKQADTVRSFNVGIAHLDTLDQLVDALNSGDVKRVNAASNLFKEEFGGTAPANFEAAKQVVGDEVLKAVIGAGGGVSDREKAQAVLNAARSPEQLKQVTETYRHLMTGQLTGLRQQYTSANANDPTRAERFDEKLLPRTRELLQGGGKPQGAGAPPEAVKMLSDNPTPEMKAHFDEVFGPGAADKALGGGG